MSEEKDSSYIYDREETARRRLAYIEKHAYPRARAAFSAEPELKSAVLMVAQYWDDEADDAVHGEIAFSTREAPDLEAYFERLARDEEEDDDLDWEVYEARRLVVESADIGRSLSEKLGDTWLSWDDNGEAIPLFAGFCKEACHQEMPTHEAYTPVALIRRGPGTILSTEILGVPSRPWLEGIRPEWWGEDDGPDEPEPTEGEARGAAGIIDALMKKWRG